MANSALNKNIVGNIDDFTAPMTITNSLTGHGLEIDQVGALAAGTNHALWIHTSTQQDNQRLLSVEQQHASSTRGCAEFNNAGVGHCVGITNSNASNTNRVLSMTNAGTGDGIYITQNGVLASSKAALYVYSNAAQVNSVLVQITQDNASSTAGAIQLNNDGTGRGIYFLNTNASNTLSAFEVVQSGTGPAVNINQSSPGGASGSLRVYSNAVNVSGPLVQVFQDNPSSSTDCIHVNNDGTGDGIQIDGSGNNRSLMINHNNTTTPAIRIDNTNTGGNCSGIYIDTNASTSVGYAFEFVGDEIVTAAVGGTQNRKIRVKVGGTDYYIPCYTT